MPSMPKPTANPTAQDQACESCPWPLFMKNANRQGDSSYDGPTTSTLKTKTLLSGAIRASPVINDASYIYIGTQDGYFYCIDGDTHEIEWTYQTADAISGSASISANDHIYFGDEGGTVYALDGSDGTELWTFSVNGSVYSSPTIGAAGRVNIATDEGLVYAFNGDSGDNTWSYDTGAKIKWSSPALRADDMTYIGNNDGTITAINGLTGELEWTYDTEGDVRSSPVLSSSGAYVYVASYDESVYCLDGDDGTLYWSTDLSTSGYVADGANIEIDSTPALYEWYLVLGLAGDADCVVALNHSTGDVLWSFDTEGPVLSSVAVDDTGIAYFASEGEDGGNGYTYAVDVETGAEIWSYEMGDAVEYSSPAIGSSSELYIGCEDEYIYIFSDS